MTYRDSIDWLFNLQKSGVKLGLDNMRHLCRAIGDPQHRLKFVHIAGTNGKGSCSAFLESILRQAGYRVGLFTSPHLVEFVERIQVDRAPMSREELVRQIGYFMRVVEDCRAEGVEPTFFEVATAMAFRCFKEAGVDIVVLETGLGGRLDSSNVVEPECCLITSIGYDHMNYLGDTIESIAAEKAGILKTGRPVVYPASLPPEAGRVLCSRAKELGCPIVVSGRPGKVFADQGSGLLEFESDGHGYQIGLKGSYQPDNAILVLKACDALETLGWKIPQQTKVRGLLQAKWPGRFEIIAKNPPLVVDGAHNPDGLRLALESWTLWCGAGPEEIVFGCLADKDVEGMIRLIDRPGTSVRLAALASPRTASLEEMRRSFHRAEVSMHADVRGALERARAGGGGVLVTGSLYLTGQVLALLHDREHEVPLNG
ncbi:MAG: bifunctional folylpolyglutamate synthase/dihydrofolate synthase [Methylacidiphilales bacterium]|nr:bifunctional folylpolyglutamate synthase/dihydrofolate synthase [Candidatus Methylacidiphilales bacterium]